MNLFLSDGNAKDTVKVTPNMVFNYDDTTEVQDLEDFKLDLVEHILKCSFYQNEPAKQINMLKLPVIMAPSLVGKQVNRDVDKKSLLDKEIEYNKDAYKTFCKLIQEKKINILNIHKMTLAELKSIMNELDVPIGERNATLLRTELENMAKIFMAGQVSIIVYACHKLIEIVCLLHSRQQIVLTLLYLPISLNCS